MPVAFYQSLRSLDSDRARSLVAAVAVAAALLVAWVVWFVRAEVVLYEVTDRARMEAAEAAHSVDVPVSGRISAVHFVLGADVREGDVLAELDTEVERRQVAEENTRLVTLEPQIEATERALAAQGQVLVDDQRATATALDGARARSQEALIAANQAVEEATRGGKLAEGGVISELEKLRLQAEAERRRMTTQALNLDVETTKGEQKKRASEGLTRVEDLRRDLASLRGIRAITLAAIDVLSTQIAKRSIRAPVSGRIGEVAQYKAGAYVAEGDRLATIIPEGELRVVAMFVPSASIGRINPGQVARMRLDGFPWAQYGMVAATVTRAGNEVRDGRVRIEFEVHRDPKSLIPLQHGLPGTIEVEVERLSPARLVFRSLGKLFGAPVPANDARSGERG